MNIDRYRNKVVMSVDTSKLGVRIMSEKVYKYPKGHPCYGCIFTLNTSKPSCMTGSSPDTENCIYTFYKKINKKKD